MPRDNETYEKIFKVAKDNGLTARDAAAFYAAYEQASASSFGSHKIGCVIVIGNSIVGRGNNTDKSDPVQRQYNLLYRNFTPAAKYSNREHSLHAEMAALKSIPYPVAQQLDWSKARAYVFRICPGLPLGQGLAAPCSACAHALRDRGIRKVFFSTEYGFASSHLTPTSELVVHTSTANTAVIGA